MPFSTNSDSDNKDPDLSGDPFGHLGVDLFEQFITFDPMDRQSPVQSASAGSPHVGWSYEKDHSAQPPDCPDTIVAKGTLQRQLPRERAVFAAVFTDHDTSSHPMKSSQSHSDSLRRAVMSESEYYNSRGTTLHSALSLPNLRSSLPTSPLSPPATTAFSRRDSRAAASISRAARYPNKTIPSPKMMRTSQYSQQQTDIWGHSMKGDSLDMDFHHQIGHLSPPPSARLSDTSDCSAKMMSMGEQHHDGYSYHTRQYSQPLDYHSPMSTPALDHHLSRRTSLAQTSLDGIMYPMTPQLRNSSISSWTQAPPPSELHAYASNASYVSDVEAAPVWWNHAAAAPMAEPTPSAYHQSSDPQSTKSLTMHLQNQVAYQAQELSSADTGLCITGLPHSPVHQSYIVESNGHQAYPDTPSQSYLSSSRHYAPSASSFSHLEQPRSASIGSDSPSPKCTASPAFHIKKSKSCKALRQSTRPSPSGAVDFVNFTPSDSRKILTGVAPSGSSKTKARREKEAMEKRRRLSQAALRIVRAAGGNVDSLVEEGLLV